MKKELKGMDGWHISGDVVYEFKGNPFVTNKEFTEAHNAAIDAAYKHGFEDAREMAVQLCNDGYECCMKQESRLHINYEKANTCHAISIGIKQMKPEKE